MNKTDNYSRIYKRVIHNKRKEERMRIYFGTEVIERYHPQSWPGTLTPDMRMPKVQLLEQKRCETGKYSICT